MAYNDPNDGGGGGGDWWSENAPPPPNTAGPYPTQGGSASLAAIVAQIYRTALGREATDDEIQQQIQGGSGDLATIQKSIYGSAEAQAYNTRRSTPAAPTTTGSGGPARPPATIGLPTTGFGAPPDPYKSDPNEPTYDPLPDYVPPTWQGGDFVNPTEADLLASPGYQARLDDRIKAAGRQFAAQGTVLNGGTLKALDRSAQDYATNEYQTFRGNALEAYREKYGQFTDAAGMSFAARTANANEHQNTFANRTSTYNNRNARTLSDYLTNVTTHRNAELDYWGRLRDVSGPGADLSGSSYRP